MRVVVFEAKTIWLTKGELATNIHRGAGQSKAAWRLCLDKGPGLG
jgi:hypothetical protein